MTFARVECIDVGARLSACTVKCVVVERVHAKCVYVARCHAEYPYVERGMLSSLMLSPLAVSLCMLGERVSTELNARQMCIFLSTFTLSEHVHI